jgi:diguanylate cyclase (GGDEF)-like protein/PAS domain S-box-containing protein
MIAAARLAARLLRMPNGFVALVDGDGKMAVVRHGTQSLRIEDVHALASTVAAKGAFVACREPAPSRSCDCIPVARSDLPDGVHALCAAPVRIADGELAGVVGGFNGAASTPDTASLDALGELALLVAGDAVAQRRAATAEALAQRHQRSEQRLRAALDSLPLHFWVTDAAGRYVEQNIWDRFAFGDLRGSAAHNAEPPLARATLWRRLHQRVLAGETVRHGSWRSHPNGQGERWVESIMAPLAEDGSIIGLVGMTVDRTAQVEAENRLKESEARLKAAIDALPFPFFICDAEGRHIMQNRSDRQLWGDAIGKTSAETGLPPEIVAHMPRTLERVQAGETVRELLRYNCDGQLRDIEEIYAPVRTDHGIAGFVGLAIDHTERTAAEERVRRSEARLAAYLATASDWLWETDEAHRLVSLSGWPAYFKVSAEKLLGRTRWAFAGVDPATDPAWQMHFVDLQARRPFRRFVYPYARSNAPPVWIEVSGDPFFDEIGDFRGYRGTARDVTEQRRAMQALSEAHAKLEAMTISGLIGITNGHGFLIEDANDAFLEMLGRDRSELRDGLDWRQLVPPDDVSEEVAAADIRRSSGDSYTTETAYRHADGHYVPVLLNVVVLDGEEQRWFALIQDLTPMKLAESQIRELAERDPLTGLANRHVLFERLAGDLGERRAPGTKGALMLLDLDGFKEINDSHGHQAGDHLLRLIGDRLKSVLRETDTIARVGGDEFAVIARGLHDAGNAADVAEKILSALREPMTLDQRLVRPDGSIGVCLFPADGREPAELMKKADIALYAAKAAGRSMFRFFEPALVTKMNERRQIREALQQARAAESFSIELQPQRHLGSGRLVGLEALVRWQLDGRPLMPEAFIGLAEETGQIVALGQIVRRQALEAMHRLDQAGLAAGSIAVNVSTIELERPDFATEIDQLLDELAISPARLVIEVSETMLDDQRIECISCSIDALRRLGISVALDNFGRGHGSLTQLRRLAFDCLKIDRCLVERIDDDEGDRLLVRGIIEMAHAMGLTVVAEGVETTTQLGFLRDLGCDIVQGFLLAEPLALAELLAYLEAEKAAPRPAQ